MNTLTSITGGLTTNLLPLVMSAVLSILGLLTALVFAFWGAMHVLALLSGKPSGWVSYKVGRVFGELVYENRYEKYVASRRQAEQRQRYRQRYDRENK